MATKTDTFIGYLMDFAVYIGVPAIIILMAFEYKLVPKQEPQTKVVQQQPAVNQPQFINMHKVTLYNGGAVANQWYTTNEVRDNVSGFFFRDNDGNPVTARSDVWTDEVVKMEITKPKKKNATSKE